MVEKRVFCIFCKNNHKNCEFNFLSMSSPIDFSNLRSLKNTGADLTQYSIELQKERNNRSLTLRRSNRPTIAGLLHKDGNSSRTSLIDPTKYPFLNPDVAVQILSSGNPSKISEFASNILTTSAASPKLLSSLAHSQAVCETICEIFPEERTETTLVNIMNIIATLFPLADNMKEAYIDGGIVCTLMDYLQSESLILACNSILLIKTLCDASLYARDSILTFGVHTILMDLAAAAQDETIVVDACKTISSVFEKKDQIDTAILSSAIPQLVPLLNLPFTQAVVSILNTLTSITTHMPALIFDIFDTGKVPAIIEMLENQDLVAAALSLIGNLSAAHPIQIQQMFDVGLMDKLTPLTTSPLAGDVFFVFSNLIASVPSLVIPLFDQPFIESALEIAQTSMFEIKKEVAFFLTTLVMHIGNEEMLEFIRPDFIDLIIEMLGCGVAQTITSCLNVMQRFAMAMANGDAETSLISESQWEDLADALEDLSERSPPTIKEMASNLLQRLEAMNEDSD